MIKVGDKFQTRDGQTAVIEEIYESRSFPVRGRVNGVYAEWLLDGSYSFAPDFEHSLDLIIPPEPAMTTIEIGKTYKMRNGETVLIKATDIDGAEPILGVRKYEFGSIHAALWFADGRFSERGEHPYDIMIEPERVSLWANWYGNSPAPDSYYGWTYTSREEADKISEKARTHVLEIITENGEPVDVKIHKVPR